MGETFASRVAGSLLHAIGLAELATTNLAAYEALASELARDPERLRALRAGLVEHRAASPLFDAALFTSHLEAAYAAMWARHLAGEPADHLIVPRTGGPPHAIAPELIP
jgi:protein O-GlcNAc transferase